MQWSPQCPDTVATSNYSIRTSAHGPDMADRHIRSFVPIRSCLVCSPAYSRFFLHWGRSCQTTRRFQVEILISLRASNHPLLLQVPRLAARPINPKNASWSRQLRAFSTGIIRNQNRRASRWRFFFVQCIKNFAQSVLRAMCPSNTVSCAETKQKFQACSSTAAPTRSAWPYHLAAQSSGQGLK